MKNICLLYALYAGIVIQVAAGNPPSSGIIVRGTVTDTVGAVIWHASLRITAIPDTKHPQAIEESGKARAVVTAETDQNGRFSVELQPGDYQICVSREAFSTACREIETAARQEINLNFPLTLDPAYQQAHAPAASEVMDQRLQKLAGPTAIACGHVKVNTSSKNATACVQRAFTQNKPFYVRYDVVGIDAEIAGGLASSGSHSVYAVTFDSMGMSTEGLTDEETMPDGSHTVVTPCPKPVKIRKDSQGRVTCFKRNQKPRWILDE
jgi:autotransporter translocation and assembly factor TamB